MNEPLAARRFAELTVRKRRLEEDLRGVNKSIRDLETALEASMILQGIRSLTLEGVDGAEGAGVTVYFDTRTRTSVKEGVERSRVADALRGCGSEWADLVHEDFNLNSLSASVREADKQGHEIPPEIAGLIDVKHDPVARARIASPSK